MSRGVLLIANNNDEIDYIFQACYSAKRIKKHLNIPVSLITDSPELFNTTYNSYQHLFDKIISYNENDIHSLRTYKDGYGYSKILEFKNKGRSIAYDLSPYDETILLDTDIVIFNNVYLNCFNQKHNLLMYRSATDLSPFRTTTEFERIVDSGIDFYWATCVFFRKTPETQIFFELTKHIQENWDHYRIIYGITSNLFRNDFVFSIAAHTLNGFGSETKISEFPGKLLFTTDRDEVVSLDDNSVTFLLPDSSNADKMVASRIEYTNVHIMNKYSFDRIIKNDS
jgi:hypothetical protein